MECILTQSTTGADRTALFSDNGGLPVVTGTTTKDETLSVTTDHITDPDGIQNGSFTFK